MYEFYALELYRYVEMLVGKAYHHWYLDDEANWCHVDSVELVDVASEEPVVVAHVSFGSKFDGNFNIEVSIDLAMSDDWNIGLIAAMIQEAFNANE